jgi:DNA-binding transcriptional ArsR family regulator
MSAKITQEIIDRREKVANFYKAGVPIRKIARKLEVSEATISGDLKAVFEPAKRELATRAKVIIEAELETLRDLRSKIYAKANEGDLFALDRVLKLMEREHKLLGLEPTAKVEVLLRGKMESLLAALEAGLSPDAYSEVLKVLSRVGQGMTEDADH